MRMLSFESWKTMKDGTMDTAFTCWCFTNGIDPHASYTSKGWSALWEGFLNDWLDVNVNAKHVSYDAIEVVIEPITKPTRVMVVHRE